MLNIGPRKYASYQLTNQTIRSPYWSAQNRMMEIIKENEQARKLYGKLSQPSGGPSSLTIKGGDLAEVAAAKIVLIVEGRPLLHQQRFKQVGRPHGDPHDFASNSVPSPATTSALPAFLPVYHS
ncbi:hypothetical protein PGT21_033033 [Puccinia graminis f. sp. tritici]|uniref:Uncharacterized protein n=1 Tax=Puccinia graminis f. sp. tritici TaxID=56615 RepID=A0A5B0MXN2_PUCGR|nr:hypothetical protein PGT21_033033 [Puccinia graminis f. sp. tritici]